ncbi:MAG: thiamine pyrophosphate-binding protein [Actinobacteria bacterium]|nr:thiamine pyrophosphate-binding protein [Actinomycetota bacterium]
MKYAPYDSPTWGSDVMAEVVRGLGYKYVSLNPGSSFRGLHDSLVNYCGNDVEMIECPHEKIAVALAHGYAKASGEPMAVILHDLVGLLHGTMGIYYAYIDRVPVMIMGGSGPFVQDHRRPNIDWIHSANVQGEAVRAYTKWDHEPRSINSVPSIMARAHRVAVSEPAGPVYVALDAGLQESELNHPVDLSELDKLSKVPSAVGPDPAALKTLAERLCSAHRPVLIAGHAGRDPKAFDQLVELAELVGIGVIDTGIRLSFPNQHPLESTDTGALEKTDCLFFLDVKDMGKATQKLDSISRTVVSKIPKGASILDLGFNDLGLSSWSEDYAELIPVEVQVTADSSIALPLLLEQCEAIVALDDEQTRTRRQNYKAELSELHQNTWDQWHQKAEKSKNQSPVSTATLAGEVWKVVKNYDWVLTANTVANWAKRIWDFDKPYRHPGIHLGTATQIGISLGVALAHKGTGRLVVDLQPDGDLMFDAGALWVGAKYELPLLVVMFNNRAYYNDWEHQERLAKQRGTPMDRANIGMEIDGPAPDFASLARSFSWWAEGPIFEPDQIEKAVSRAAEYVTTTGKPALVDVVCQPK